MKNMKRLVFFGLVIILFTACQNQPERFTTDSPNLDVLKKLVADYHAGDWDAWKSNYADTAKIYHNNWAKASTPDEIRDGLKGLLANTSKYGFDEEPIFYEQVIDDNGVTWSKFWGNWRGTLKANGKELTVPVHLACILTDGKITTEYAFYNLGELNAELAEIEASNNLPIEDKTIIAQVDNFVDNYLNKQDESVLNEIVADDYVRFMNDVKVATGAKELQTSMAPFFAGFSDFNITNPHRSAVFNNTMFVHWQMTGTNDGEFAGSPATGKKVKITGLSTLNTSQVPSKFLITTL